jgi:hypothetical protein
MSLIMRLSYREMGRVSEAIVDGYRRATDAHETVTRRCSKSGTTTVLVLLNAQSLLKCSQTEDLGRRLLRDFAKHSHRLL